MFPPIEANQLNVEAISGIFGSISITCWLVVFTPQIVENFRNRSTDGLSLRFIVIWAFGDVFNVIGGVAQQILPTQLILAIYYVAVDVVLLGQFFVYGGMSSKPKATSDEAEQIGHTGIPTIQRSNSQSSAANLSPATPFHDAAKLGAAQRRDHNRSTKRWALLAIQALSVPLICLVGVLGWWISGVNKNYNGGSRRTAQEQEADLKMDIVGQVFGYLCAVTYLGSRLPQIMLNYQRKSTEGM
ncbi:MAG: hypothetical protein M1814_000527 [Vezdaea aestivalis]|nr:MAG: hypothetical protein M1814_000527 [Vezdaea aestivalis]